MLISCKEVTAFEQHFYFLWQIDNYKKDRVQIFIFESIELICHDSSARMCPSSCPFKCSQINNRLYGCWSHHRIGCWLNPITYGLELTTACEIIKQASASIFHFSDPDIVSKLFFAEEDNHNQAPRTEREKCNWMQKFHQLLKMCRMQHRMSLSYRDIPIGIVSSLERHHLK